MRMGTRCNLSGPSWWFQWLVLFFGFLVFVYLICVCMRVCVYCVCVCVCILCVCVCVCIVCLCVCVYSVNPGLHGEFNGWQSLFENFNFVYVCVCVAVYPILVLTVTWWPFFFQSYVCVCVYSIDLSGPSWGLAMAGIFSMNNLYTYVYLCVFMVLLTNRTVHVDFSSRNFFF